MGTPLRFAALNIELPGSDAGTARIQLLPAGEFRALDGRPFDAPIFRLNATQAAMVLADAAARTNDFMIDYEHQSIHLVQNGLPNPAAGWFKQLEFDPAQGLFATDVRWTDRARQMISAGEYRYISAWFIYTASGDIVKLFNAGLTNTPAVDGMNELSAAASQLFIQSSKEKAMDEQLRQALCSLFGLADDADESAITAAVGQTHADVLKPAACSTLADLIRQKDNRITALSQTQTAVPDPSQFVPVAVFEETRQQLAALSVKVSQTEADALIEAALSDGRITAGADETWMRGLAEKDMDTFKAGLSIRKPNPALAGLQTGGKAPDTLNATALSADQQKLLGAMGLGENFLSDEGGK